MSTASTPLVLAAEAAGESDERRGRLGRRRPRPARRLARAGLAAPKISGGAVGQADPNDKE